MGETKREEGHPAEEGSDAVSGSGVVERERETTPAPPGAAQDWTALPSARPTALPEFDLVALAYETSLPHPKLPSIPLDVSVPIRTNVLPPPDIKLREAFVLLHVDGRASVNHIAEMISLPVDEVLGCILKLTAAGLVELGASGSTARAVPESGDRTRGDAPPESR